MKRLFYIFIVLFFICGHSRAQVNTIDSLNALIAKATNDKEILRLTLLLPGKDENMHKSIAYANKAIGIATKVDDKNALAKLLNIIAVEYFDNYLYQDGIPYAQKAYNISLSNKDKVNQSSALLCLGRSYYEIGKLTEAMNFLNAQQRLFPVEDIDEIIMCYNSIAAIYLDQGNFKMAHEYYMKEIKLAEKWNLQSYVAQAYNNLANIYDEQKNYEKALEYYKKDFEITKTFTNDEEGLCLSYNNLGNTYLNMKEYALAKENIEKAIEIAERLNYKYGLAIFYNSLGSYYEETGDKQKALLNYKKDLENAKQSGTKNNLALSYFTLGEFFQKNNNWEDARDNYLAALEIANEVGGLNIISMVYKGLAKIAEQQNDFTNAYNYHILHKTFYDSIFNKESQKTVAEMSTRYESEKKEQTIALLNKEQELKNNEIKKQKLIRYSFTIGFVLMLVLVFMVFKSYRIKQKANDMLAFQKREIEVKNSELHLSKNELQKQKDLVDVKQKEIVDSINYAQRIQYSLLAHEDVLKENLRQHFTVFKPKDIVSGDFYWATSAGGQKAEGTSPGAAEPSANSHLFFLAVCDSTGHGVPGAFMSLLNIGFLSEAINEKGITEPYKIFNYVRQRLIDNISKENQKDGFDGILLCFDKRRKKITYASANLKAFMVNGGSISELSTDKMPVGMGERQSDFNLYELNYSENASLYICTDGYADQFGGPKGKKFKNKQLSELILNISHLSFNEQEKTLIDRFNQWKGDLEQVDDVCVLGLKI